MRQIIYNHEPTYTFHNCKFKETIEDINRSKHAFSYASTWDNPHLIIAKESKKLNTERKMNYKSLTTFDYWK